MLVGVIIGVIALSGGFGKESKYLGTWDIHSVKIDGSILTIEEVEVAYDDTLSDFRVIIKEGGKAYLHVDGESELIDWTLTEEDGFMLGEQACTIEDGMLTFQFYEVVLYFTRTSKSQTITALETPNNQGGKPNPNDSLIAPTEEYIISRLQKVPAIIEIAAATEDNDPNGQMNKPGGYTAHVYFSYELVNQDEVYGDDLISKGTTAGGSIEVYSTVSDANRRNEYLASFDGTVLSSGSHTVIGSVVVRTSDELTATQQELLESNIIAALKGEDNKIVSPTPSTGNNNNDNAGNNTDSMSDALSDAEAFALEFETEYPDDYFTPNYLNEHLQYVLDYSETAADYAVANANINWNNHANKYAQVYLTYVEEFGRPANWCRPSDIEGMLLGDGFPRDVVEATMSAIDWTYQAKKYLKHLSDFYDVFDRVNARWYLERIDTTEDDVEYLLENSGVDWDYHAYCSLKNYLEETIPTPSKKECIVRLEECGFNESEITYALDNCGVDWYAKAVSCLGHYIEDVCTETPSREECENQLAEWGFNSDEISYAINEFSYIWKVVSYDDPQYLKYTLNSDNQTYSVTGIGQFDGKNLDIPSTYNGKKVTTISNNAFRDCTSLINVTIPNTVTSIGDYAFCFCTSLTNINIPDSVESIGYQALYGCSSLKYNTYDNALYIGNSNNPYLVLMKAKNGSITSCEINDTTKFLYNKNFTSIGWQGGVQAFAYCSQLTEIIIPDSVKSIGPIAFYGCTSLKSVKIGNSVTSIGDTAFRNCTSLANLTIGNSVASIGKSAFADCTSLTCVIIPNSVTSIGGFAFYGCSSLTDIHFEGTIDQWNAISKDNAWNAQTGDYTIHCTNGTITKYGTVTYK